MFISSKMIIFILKKMNVLKRFNFWVKDNPMLGGIVSVILVAAPFILGMLLSAMLIEGETLKDIIIVVLFAAYLVTYYFFTKFMNNL